MGHNNQGLSAIRPKIKECHIHQGESKIVLEGKIGQIVLPKEHLHIINLFDGEHSIKDITSEIYQGRGTVSFNSIITTVHLLHDAGLLEDQDLELAEIKKEKSPHEQHPSILIRPLWEKTLISKISFQAIKSQVLFVLLSSIIVSAIVLSFINKQWNYNFEEFLKWEGHYTQALLRLLGITSFLMSAKAIVKSFLMLTSVGQIFQFNIRLNPFSLSFHVGENSIYTQEKKFMLVLYGFVTATLYLFLASVFSHFYPESILGNDIRILAILLTFIELDPYKQSELTKIFNFFYQDEQLKSMTPFLKNCSLSTIINDQKTKFSDELRFYIYSLLAISWAVSFTLFSIDLMVVNLPALFLEVQIGEISGRISSGIVISMLSFMFFYLSIDLVHTLFNNLAAPFILPFAKLFKRSSKYTQDDVTNDSLKLSMKKNSFFNHLSNEVLDKIITDSQVKTIKKGKTLFLQDEKAAHFYFLIRGEVELTYREQTGRTKSLVKLLENNIFGEMSILNDSPRTANATSLTDIVYLEISIEYFRQLMSDEKFSAELSSIKNRVEISQFVSSAGLFNDFPPEIMNIFVESGDLVLFPAHQEIVTQGEDDKTFYLLIRGKVDIIVGKEKVAELGQGDFFGEIALIADTPRTATVRTQEECLFLYIENNKFWNILSENIDLAMYIESIGRHRLEKAA